MTNQPTDVTIDQPLSQALTYTKRIFSPFDASKWLGLAFCAFLTNCAKGGGSGAGNTLDSFNSPISRTQPWSGNIPSNLGELYKDSIEPFLDSLLVWGGISIAIIFWTVVVTVLLTRILTLWIQSRGHFMFIDGILHNRGNVIEPCERFKGLAFSLFLTRLSVDLFMYIGLGIFGALIGFGIYSIPIAFIGLLLVLIAVGMTHFLIDTLVIPAMYKSNTPASQVWPTVKSDVITGHWGDILYYLLLRIGLTIGAGILTVVITLCTCCLPIIPYIGTVVLLPIIVFMRSHQLAFYEELTGSPLVDVEATTLLT